MFNRADRNQSEMLQTALKLVGFLIKKYFLIYKSKKKSEYVQLTNYILLPILYCKKYLWMQFFGLKLRGRVFFAQEKYQTRSSNPSP